jgi:hypothetical protein
VPVRAVLMLRRVLGVVCCVVGAVWVGQGVGWIGGSFMTGEAVWAVIGAVAILIGVALLRSPRGAGGGPDDA